MPHTMAVDRRRSRATPPPVVTAGRKHPGRAGDQAAPHGPADAGTPRRPVEAKPRCSPPKPAAPAPIIVDERPKTMPAAIVQEANGSADLGVRQPQGGQALRPPGLEAAVRRAGHASSSPSSRSARMSIPPWASRPMATACAGPWCRSRAAPSASPSSRTEQGPQVTARPRAKAVETETPCRARRGARSHRHAAGAGRAHFRTDDARLVADRVRQQAVRRDRRIHRLHRADAVDAHTPATGLARRKPRRLPPRQRHRAIGRRHRRLAERRPVAAFGHVDPDQPVLVVAQVVILAEMAQAAIRCDRARRRG